MKFYIGDDAELELSPEFSQNILLVNDTTFKYEKHMYVVTPIEFKIEDAYFLFHDMIKKNPGKKIFVHHFESLANDYYALYYAIEL